MAILCDRLPLNASVSSAYSAVCTAPSGYQGRFGWSVSLTYENRYGGSSSKLSLSTCCAIIDGMSRHNISMNCPCCLASMGRFPAGRSWTRSSPGSGSDTGSKRRSEKDAGPPVLSRWIVTSPGEGLLFASICLQLKEVPANLLSLGALDFGMVVDGAIVMVENIVRHLGHQERVTKSVRDRIRDAAHEVQRPVFYAITIIITAYLPIFTLQRVEGRLFRPMAWTVAFALLGAVIFSMT